ncbi:MAG: 4Fe-4S double cluster binding domain-containing protein [Clostridia bacterium]
MNNILQDFIKDNNIKYYAVANDNGDSVFLFLMPYAPFIFPTDVYEIDSYYLISNDTYHRENKLINNLNKGICEDYDLNFNCIFYEHNWFNGYNDFSALFARRHNARNLRILAAFSGLGKIADNGFLYNSDYGTYNFIGSVVLPQDFPTIEFSLPDTKVKCLHCAACSVACPTNAVETDKWNCLRSLQECAHIGLSNTQQLYAKKLNNRLLGCNNCQKFCPINSNITAISPPVDFLELIKKENFDNALSNGNFKPLAEYIGANYARSGKLKPIVDLINKTAK